MFVPSVGWLKTVDEYYLGANQTIQEAAVQFVLDTVIAELARDPTKTFSYVEIAFFSRWWREQDDQTKALVKRLVQEGRFEFINAGWCMNDESGVSDEGIITQMSLGHRFILENFGQAALPTVASQLDPFGHSNTYAALSGAGFGFSSIFFARIDYQDYANRKQNKALEWIWQPSTSAGNSSAIFAHAMWDGTYCIAHGFDFEDDNTPPINDDPNLEGVNVQDRANLFAGEVAARAQVYRTDNILFMYGCDFEFANARVNFKNMDKLMRYINAHPEIYNFRLVYSTQSRYAKAVNSAGIPLPLKTDDIFPYADHPYAYWTGYMTSRPALKGYVRTRNALLHAADKIVSIFSNFTSSVGAAVNVLRAAFSVAQHHDAVAGTSQQHVADDYARLMANGSVAAQRAVASVVSSYTSVKGLTFCEYLNDTRCDAITFPLRAGQSVPVVVYNSLAWDRLEPVTVPCAHLGDYVQGVNASDQQVAANPFNGRLELTFLANVPALSFGYFVVKPGSKRMQKRKPLLSSISNEFYTIEFDPSRGTIQSVNGQPFRLNHLWYNESAGNNVNSSQPSGAYIFRPNSTVPFSVCSGPLQVSFVQGALFEEASAKCNSWLSYVVRLYRGQDYIEVRSRVGPIDISDGMGKEVILRLDSSVLSGTTFYTDSNWEEMQQRILNYRPSWTLNVTNPVAGNYYPMNQAAFIRNSTQNLQLSILSDRSRGCSSLNPGQFEMMLHRRLLFDDNRGVGEPLNESEPILTVSHLHLGPPSPLFRQRGMRLNHPLLPMFGAPLTSTYQPRFAQAPMRSFALPDSVHLMDLQTLNATHKLVRLRHMYAANEALPYSRPVTFSLSSLPLGTIHSLQETQLSGVQSVLALNQRMQWKVENGGVVPPLNTVAQKPNDLNVTLSPMQIRTFVVRTN